MNKDDITRIELITRLELISAWWARHHDDEAPPVVWSAYFSELLLIIAELLAGKAEPVDHK